MAPQEPLDPMRTFLTHELRRFRRGDGPLVARLGALPWMVDTLGGGSVDEAGARLMELRDERGSDPTTDIGALFWLARQGEAARQTSLEQRLTLYKEAFNCDARTGLRRSDRAIRELAGTLRHYSDSQRPRGEISIFQSGPTATVVVDLWMSRETYRPAVIFLDGEEAPPEPFLLHNHDDFPDGWYRARRIFDETPLHVEVGPYEPCLTVQVTWDMPVLPAWQLTGWVADPRFVLRLQVFRERAALLTMMHREGAATRSDPSAR